MVFGFNSLEEVQAQAEKVLGDTGHDTHVSSALEGTGFSGLLGNETNEGGNSITDIQAQAEKMLAGTGLEGQVRSALDGTPLSGLFGASGSNEEQQESDKGTFASADTEVQDSTYADTSKYGTAVAETDNTYGSYDAVAETDNTYGSGEAVAETDNTYGTGDNGFATDSAPYREQDQGNGEQEGGATYTKSQDYGVEGQVDDLSLAADTSAY